MGCLVAERCWDRRRWAIEDYAGVSLACGAHPLAAGGRDAVHSSPSPHHPAARSEIARSAEPTGVLAQRFGMSTETIRKWRKRGAQDCQDHSSRPHKLPWKATQEERAIGCAIRPAFPSMI